MTSNMTITADEYRVRCLVLLEKRSSLMAEIRSVTSAMKRLGFATSRRPRKRTLTRAWKNAILMRDNYTCRYCGAHATHVDHVMSLYDGGTDSLSNLVAACVSCNLRKGKKSYNLSDFPGTL